jgi:host factor-I protein
MLESEGRQQMLYKHAISTIAPAQGIDLREAEAEETE